MNVKQLLVDLAKLILCGLAFFVGMIIGGIVPQALQLKAPAMPAGTDMAGILVYTLLISPIFAVALAVLSRNLAGGFVTRMLVLSFLMWIAYAINNQLDAWLYMPDSVNLAYMAISSLGPSLLCGAAVAWLFPPREKSTSAGGAIKTFFSSKSPRAWVWRLALAAVAFMPIYYFFGLIVIQFTGAFYAQNMYGLRFAGIELILPIQFLRSLLFLLACLPVMVLWQKSARSLFIRLGVALFVLVGLQTATAYFMPLSLRLPHTLEILADEFVYAGVLVGLLVKREVSDEARETVAQPTAAR